MEPDSSLPTICWLTITLVPSDLLSKLYFANSFLLFLVQGKMDAGSYVQGQIVKWGVHFDNQF